MKMMSFASEIINVKLKITRLLKNMLSSIFEKSFMGDRVSSTRISWIDVHKISFGFERTSIKYRID